MSECENQRFTSINMNRACYQCSHNAIFYWNFQKILYAVKIIFSDNGLSVSGIYKIMHCGILINSPYLDQYSGAREGPTPKQRLLIWVQNKVPELPIKNFTTDWNDGKAIGALVDAVGPGECYRKPSHDLDLCVHVHICISHTLLDDNIHGF